MSQQGVGEAGQPLFQQKATVEPCSWNQCTAGHRWPMTMLVAKCPGCGADGLALKLESCPFCNEPAATSQMRMDVVPAGAGYIPRCRGAQSVFSSIDITLDRQEGAEAQQRWQPFGKKKESPSGAGTSQTQ